MLLLIALHDMFELHIITLLIFFFHFWIFIAVGSMDVDAVLGHTATLPCEITPDTREDRVYMVLWFRENSGKPLYRYVCLTTLYTFI